MGKKIELTFKRQARATGLAAVGSPDPSVDVKINGEVCGYIAAPDWRSKSNLWTIYFSVYRPIERQIVCEWCWATLKYKAESEEAVRTFLKENIETIVKSLPPLYFTED